MFTLNRKRNNKFKIKEVRRESQLKELYELRIKTESNIDKLFSSRHTLESFKEILNNGKIWVIYDKNKIIGYTRILKAVKDLVNGYEYINTDNSITLKGTYISPEYRGKGLQRLLHLKSLKYIKEQKYSKIFSFVHPDNVASLKNLRKAGLKTHGLQKGVNGTLRMIMIKEL